MPPDIEALREAFAAHRYLFTEHASDRAVERNIASHDRARAACAGQLSACGQDYHSL
jgi:hypothetical protein